MSNPDENTGATRLEWSADEDDDFFGEDEKEISGDGWDESYDADQSMDVSAKPREDTEDAIDPEPETSDPLEEPKTAPVDETTDAGVADILAAFSDFPIETTTTPVASDTGPPSPDRGASGNPPRPPGITRKDVASPKRTVRDSTTISSASPGRTARKTQKSPSPNPGSRDRIGTNTVGVSAVIPQLSLPGTPGTPFVEVENDDENFEEIVRKRNKVRKEREDYHIAHIKVQMVRLEDALAAETKRRVDATTALDELARTQVHEMEDRVRGQLREENERLQNRLTALEERVRLLEENWTYDSNHQVDLVHNKAADITKAISQIRDDQDMEHKARLKRESILLQQVEQHAKEAEHRWTEEHNDRVQRLKELEDRILGNEAGMALEQKRYEDRIEKELTSLKEELEVETEERQIQDEQIVSALNRYTQQLQHSLSILSAD
mmetsp:Transcript_29970/g.64176  ORF Transcript_29970/g.64176 Transcript_29970/m.64176 type:complete len:438 (+) Transcript_29970:125-1438(+)